MPSLPGCASQGDTVEESLEMIKDAIEGHLQVMKEDNKGKGQESWMTGPHNLKPERGGEGAGACRVGCKGAKRQPRSLQKKETQIFSPFPYIKASP